MELKPFIYLCNIEALTITNKLWVENILKHLRGIYSRFVSIAKPYRGTDKII